MLSADYIVGRRASVRSRRVCFVNASRVLPSRAVIGDAMGAPGYIAIGATSMPRAVIHRHSRWRTLDYHTGTRI